MRASGSSLQSYRARGGALTCGHAAECYCNKLVRSVLEDSGSCARESGTAGLEAAERKLLGNLGVTFLSRRRSIWNQGWAPPTASLGLAQNRP